MDTASIKRRQQAAWASGDYAAVGSRLLPTAELLCEAVDLRAGERVLDVACGFDISDDHTLVLRMDYLEAVIHKPATP